MNDSTTPALETISVPWDIPYTAQVASPGLVQAIFEGGLDAQADPRWLESGADNPPEYAYWAPRACGVACVKMCVEALGGEQIPLVHWARAGVASGGYLTELRPDGTRAERGWLHSALAGLVQSQGLYAHPCSARLEEFPVLIRRPYLLIASVSFQIGTEMPITRRGGHLVVVSGVQVRAGQVESVIVYNPSGRTTALQEAALISAERFSQAYTGRVIWVGKENEPI